MCSQQLLLEILQQTYDATRLVCKRFEPVTSVDYFTDTPSGMEKLYAILPVRNAVRLRQIVGGV